MSVSGSETVLAHLVVDYYSSRVGVNNSNRNLSFSVVDKQEKALFSCRSVPSLFIKKSFRR
jgi:hypothetical protein